jgi:hypothetical protein
MEPAVGRRVTCSEPEYILISEIIGYSTSTISDREFERFLLKAYMVLRRGSSINLLKKGRVFVFPYERPKGRDEGLSRLFFE